jgi:hypothetical protein
LPPPPIKNKKTLFLRRGWMNTSTLLICQNKRSAGIGTVFSLNENRLLGIIGPVPPPLWIRKLFNSNIIKLNKLI